MGPVRSQQAECGARAATVDRRKDGYRLFGLADGTADGKQCLEADRTQVLSMDEGDTWLEQISIFQFGGGSEIRSMLGFNQAKT